MVENSTLAHDYKCISKAGSLCDIVQHDHDGFSLIFRVDSRCSVSNWYLISRYDVGSSSSRYYVFWAKHIAMKARCR